MANIEKCPTCNVELEIEDSAYDQPIKCPNCGQEIMIQKPVVVTGPVKVHRKPLAPPAPQGLPAVVVVKGMDISFLDVFRLVWKFLAASFLFGLIGALFALIVRYIASSLQ
jgi:DNA-directed RNA polymerase subunit RPC12/RpoP